MVSCFPPFLTKLIDPDEMPRKTREQKSAAPSPSPGPASVGDAASVSARSRSRSTQSTRSKLSEEVLTEDGDERETATAATSHSQPTVIEETEEEAVDGDEGVAEEVQAEDEQEEQDEEAEPSATGKEGARVSMAERMAKMKELRMRMVR